MVTPSTVTRRPASDAAHFRTPRRCGRGVGRRLPALLAVGALALAAGCSDDEEAGEATSSQEAYCAAGDELRASMSSLVDLDVLAEGTNGIQDAASTVANDLDELRAAADDAAADEVATLQEAVEDVTDALSELGNDLTVDNAGAVIDAIENAASAANAVFDTLSDCP